MRKHLRQGSYARGLDCACEPFAWARLRWFFARLIFATGHAINGLDDAGPFPFGSSRYKRAQAICPPLMPSMVTPRSSKGVPSSFVPIHSHSARSVSPTTANRKLSCEVWNVAE